MKLIGPYQIELTEHDVEVFWHFFQEVEHSGIDLNALFHTTSVHGDVQFSQESIIALLELSNIMSLIDRA